MIVPREYYLGRIAEERGDRAAAREHHARFVRWWWDCDPELTPIWEDGRLCTVTESRPHIRIATDFDPEVR